MSPLLLWGLAVAAYLLIGFYFLKQCMKHSNLTFATLPEFVTQGGTAWLGVKARTWAKWVLIPLLVVGWGGVLVYEVWRRRKTRPYTLQALLTVLMGALSLFIFWTNRQEQLSRLEAARTQVKLTHEYALLIQKHDSVLAAQNRLLWEDNRLRRQYAQRLN